MAEGKHKDRSLKRHSDFRHHRFHPKAGATAVGSGLTIAYNVNLNTTDVKIAPINCEAYKGIIRRPSHVQAVDNHKDTDRYRLS